MKIAFFEMNKAPLDKTHNSGTEEDKPLLDKLDV